ncbi:hypothetical protein AGR7A_Lc140061 [Agrobacterium deltaense NCPPB 1641]|uniref:Uncharacterized protein n=1 Tax=Agrobacterium deltaense NCPPB 1641 TaxID=1183425 RepID=A0A1S7U2V2_9HYPH|nr:hypothetical protein AGR7A_Lc140061 [Agrobacterium deltaense NCPPB 1641]
MLFLRRAKSKSFKDCISNTLFLFWSRWSIREKISSWPCGYRVRRLAIYWYWLSKGFFACRKDRANIRHRGHSGR